jgi:hypothetical protein
MEQRIKGAGKLSRKVLTILALAAIPMSGIAVAQSATGPNKVYIEQVGNTNTITIEQVGGTNNVGGTNGVITVASLTHLTTLLPEAPSSSNYATISGNNNILGITQTGNNNSAQYNIKGNNNTYSSTVTGNDNQTNLRMGDANTNTTLSHVSETISGDTNTIIQTVVGNNINSTTSINGNNNQVTNSLLSTNGSVSNTIQGSFNVIDSQQIDSAGANGHQLVLNTIGSYNSITTQQQGFNDTTVNIATNGSNNTITVRSSSAAIVDPKTAIAR